MCFIVSNFNSTVLKQNLGQWLQYIFSAQSQTNILFLGGKKIVEELGMEGLESRQLSWENCVALWYTIGVKKADRVAAVL